MWPQIDRQLLSVPVAFSLDQAGVDFRKVRNMREVGSLPRDKIAQHFCKGIHGPIVSIGVQLEPGTQLTSPAKGRATGDASSVACGARIGSVMGSYRYMYYGCTALQWSGSAPMVVAALAQMERSQRSQSSEVFLGSRFSPEVVI